jgi:hypothetical protein
MRLIILESVACLDLPYFSALSHKWQDSRKRQFTECKICFYLPSKLFWNISHFKGGYTLVTLPRIVTPYRDNVDETRARVTYQKLVTR